MAFAPRTLRSNACPEQVLGPGHLLFRPSHGGRAGPGREFNAMNKVNNWLFSIILKILLHINNFHF